MNGEDVSLKLVLHSESTADRPLSININVQAMRYNGSRAVNIQNELKEETLQPGKGDAASGEDAVQKMHRRDRCVKTKLERLD